MMKKEIIKLDKKEQVLSMFHRTMVIQRPKVESNKKIYKRQKYRYEE